MPLGGAGFRIIDMPAPPDELLASYEELPVDAYMGNGTRYKKFSQYRLSAAADGSWSFERLPHRDCTAFKKFNAVGGGMRRTYLPIDVDLTPLIAVGARELDLDRGEDWQINVHQNRTRAELGRPGPLTPEGVHHDGHEFVMIGVLDRQRVSGGETRLWRPGADAPFWSGTLEPGQAVLLDDKAIAHDVTDVVSATGEPGHRDIFIVAFSRWTHKWYGDDHDAAALSDGYDREFSGATVEETGTERQPVIRDIAALLEGAVLGHELSRISEESVTGYPVTGPAYVRWLKTMVSEHPTSGTRHRAKTELVAAAARPPYAPRA
ncbi:2OG-Fe dioxygenase family protein [Streptomyces sp. NPDC006703]|uniref:2OG-Fe dioxygenase family protein n=1 Tax=Streptomyces sp. NPDC006703 TaxID=3364759 RepID=UPI00367CFE7A